MSRLPARGTYIMHAPRVGTGGAPAAMTGMARSG
jgi:hypothetical protein